MSCIDCKLYTCLNSSISLKNKSFLILQSWHSLSLSVDLQRPWKEGPMAGFASQSLTKLLWPSKRFTGWLILIILGWIAICTTAAVTDIALQTSIQKQNFIQNWTKDAHTIWVTQVQIDGKNQDKLQKLKTAIQWVGDQLIDLQKQILNCDWNSQFSITSVRFNHSAYNWEQIKFHSQDIHNNTSLNVQLLQKEIFETFSKSLSSSNNLETLAEQLADWLSGLDPRRWFQNKITHSIGSGTIMLIIILVIIFVVYRCLSTKIVQTKQT